MGITIRQIAEIAGVSRGTVDRALNDRPGINPEIKAEILKTAEIYGYKANKAGRFLSLKKESPIIGIQMPSIGNPFFDDVLNGLNDAVKEYFSDVNGSLAVRQMKGFDPATQIRQIQELVNEKISVLVVTPVEDRSVQEYLKELSSSIPVFTMNTDLDGCGRLRYIGNNYYHSGRVAAGLLSLLHQNKALKILIATGSRNILGHNQRIEGFIDCLKQTDRDADIVDVIETLDDDNDGYVNTLSALKKAGDVSAVYIAAGGVRGVCYAVRELKAKPLIISNDLIPSTKALLSEGTITATISQHPYSQGYETIHIIFNYLLNGNLPDSDYILNNDILIKENCAADNLIPPSYS